ncbi:MAG: copper homeostasis protein CutC [Actinomycetaceae bacterium]|nr:copper homeostasis protein CutC [Actinomycetaceae bacterium]
MTVLEICVQDLGGVLAARDFGADRVEVCEDLSVGGLTPSLGLVEGSLALGRVDVQVLVRPRAGDFVHDEAEVAQILRSIAGFSRLREGAGVNLGFVVGALRGDGRINVEAARAFRDAAGDAPLTFHRGFDEAPDLFEALDQLLELGYDRVLTTGGDGSVADTAMLRALQERAGEELTVLASGGLRSHNVARAIRESGAREVHMRAPLPDGSTDPQEVRRIVEAVRAL